MSPWLPVWLEYNNISCELLTAPSFSWMKISAVWWRCWGCTFFCLGWLLWGVGGSSHQVVPLSMLSYCCATASNELLGNCLSFDSLILLARGGRVFKVSRIWVEILKRWRGDCGRQYMQKEASVVTSLALRESFLIFGCLAFGGRRKRWSQSNGVWGKGISFLP